MYCKNCKVNVGYNTDVCPLCSEKLCEGEVFSPDNPVYPKRNASFRFPQRYSFSLFYTSIAFGIFLTVLLINLLTTRNVLWAFIVGAGLIYCYTLIRHTIMTSYGSASKILVQGLMLGILIYIIQKVINVGTWAYDYVIPMILSANTIVLWAVSIVRRIRLPNYAFSLIIISLVNIIPFIWFLTGVSLVLWTAITSLSLAVITIILVVSIYGKPFLNELRRLLHI